MTSPQRSLTLNYIQKLVFRKDAAVVRIEQILLIMLLRRVFFVCSDLLITD